jgi:hypothetical protein
MTGSAASGKPGYACNRRTRNDGAMCARPMNARDLEKLVVDAAKKLLTKLTLSDAAATVTLSAEDRSAIETERAELVELKDMWDHKEIKTRAYREMRRIVEKRIGRLEQKTVIRPTAEVLEGLTGLDAPANWDRLAKKGEYDRLNAVIQFLYGAVIIGESTSARGTGRLWPDQHRREPVVGAQRGWRPGTRGRPAHGRLEVRTDFLAPPESPNWSTQGLPADCYLCPISAERTKVGVRR